MGGLSRELPGPVELPLGAPFRAARELGGQSQPVPIPGARNDDRPALSRAGECGASDVVTRHPAPIGHVW
jgi:hypothetical protein